MIYRGVLFCEGFVKSLKLVNTLFTFRQWTWDLLTNVMTKYTRQMKITTKALEHATVTCRETQVCCVLKCTSLIDNTCLEFD